MKTATKLTKLSAFLLCLALSITMLVPVASAEVDPNATPVSSEADFVAIGDNATGSYVLTNDITLSDSYVPLTGFAGTLDGAGYTIKGLNLVDVALSQWSSAGLFKAVKNATVKNLTVEGTISNNVAVKGIEIGGIVGNANNSTFINCVSNVDIILGSSTGLSTIAGGIVGHCSGGTNLVSNCVNNGSITNNSSYVSNQDGNLGGMVGYAKADITIENCKNYGAISNKAFRAGGILSWNIAPTTTIINCENYAPIYGYSSGAGILCMTNTGAVTVNLTRCVNFGEITGSLHYVSGITNGNYASGITTTFNINYCANYADCTTNTTGEAFIAGIIGRNRSANVYINYCYNEGLISAPTMSAGYIGDFGGSEGSAVFTNNYAASENAKMFGHDSPGNAKYKTGNVKIDANTDLAAAVATLNTGLEAPAYRLNEGKIEALYSLNSAPVTNYGVQETEAKDGVFAVRFIGLLNGKNFTDAGFTVSATIKQEGKADVVVTDKDCKVSAAFDSLLAGNEDITIGTETVVSPLGTDFFAYTITGVPADATVTFTFTPYATATTTSVGATYTVTYVNGVLA